MSYEGFFERLIIHKDEFNFKYKDFIIEILKSKQGGESYSCYISQYDNTVLYEGFLEDFRKKNYCFYRTYKHPEELLQQFRIDEKTLKEIWDDLVWQE